MYICSRSESLGRLIEGISLLKGETEEGELKTEGNKCYLKCRRQHKSSRNMKNKENMTPPNHNTLPATGTKDMKIHTTKNSK